MIPSNLEEMIEEQRIVKDAIILDVFPIYYDALMLLYPFNGIQAFVSYPPLCQVFIDGDWLNDCAAAD